MVAEKHAKPPRKSNLQRVLRGVGIAVLVLVLLLYIGFPAAMGALAVIPARAQVGSPPQGFDEVELFTPDGVRLRGWYKPPENGAVILLLHGAGGSREAMRPFALMLASHGYGVLAFDLRGHGTSEGRTNRLGWQGTQDVGAALDFLRARPEALRIGALGSSMGGEVLLGAASAYPEIRAIAADGATRRSSAELLALESERPLVRNFTARVMYAVVGLLTGERPPVPLLQSMSESGETRFLLIAAGANPLEVAFNRLFAQTLGARLDLWVAPDVGHTGAFSRYPEEYARRLVGFFERTLE